MSENKSLSNPVWEADIIRDESLMFVRENGCACAPLLFTPKKIISLTDSHGCSYYREGVDYIVQDNKIVLTENSRIFCFDKNELYPSEPVVGHSFPTEDGFLYFSEGTFFHDRQVKITYIPTNNDFEFSVPSAISKLTRTFGLLSRHKDLNVCVFGDSISVGANASGFRDLRTVPFTPPYAELFVHGLEEKFGSRITYTNFSVGGKDSAWGVENAYQAAEVCPDLCIIAFGANDNPSDPEVCKENFSKIINTIRESNSECEFIIIASSIPNPLLTGAANFVGRVAEFQNSLCELESKRGVIMANITELQKAVVKRKRYVDITANNVNHPNDFFHRLYAQYLLSMF